MADTNIPTPLINRDEQGRWLVGTRPGWVYDIEVYPNYFCATFFDGVEMKSFDHTQLRELDQFVTQGSKVLIGYNNFKYDDAILRAIVTNPDRITTSDIFSLSGLLISDYKVLTPEQVKRRNNLIYARCYWAYSIDLFQINNGKGSLKEHQCRLGLPSVADSPVPFDRPVTIGDIPLILTYNYNDVVSTSALLEESRELIELRFKLNVDYDLGHEIFSMSEAKIAEHYMLKRYERRTGMNQYTLKKLAGASKNNLAASFDIIDLLPRVVRFNTYQFDEVFQGLKWGRIDRTPKGVLQLVTDLPGNQATIDGITLSFGRGGLHSDDEPGIYQEDEDSELWDVDAASFYPSMMIAYGIKPSHFMHVFLEELTVLRDRRLAAKAAKDKLTANSLKLVINAIFGKLGDMFSALRDDRACMQVTIGGQVLLLMLIEAVTVAGAKVLSANTDGLMLRVPKANAEAVYASLRTWEQRTKITIEEQGYRLFAQRDVNNYIAVSSKLDDQQLYEVKTKGAYNADAAKLSGRIIPLAVQEHLRTGKSVKDIIDQHTEAADFLLYQRAQSEGHFEYKGAKLPKTIRWYVPIITDADAAIERVVASGTRRTTVPHAHRATLALELPKNFGVGDLPGLARSYYVEQAQKLLNSALASVEVERGTQQARMLQAMGLTLLPQRSGKNPTGIALDDLGRIQEISGRRSERWAVVTGAGTQVLTLDIDNLPALDPTFLSIIQQCPSLTTWHGTATADDVRAGRKRGAIHFHYDGLDARIGTRATKAWVDKYGFEIAFGKKVQTVIGQHLEDLDDYVQDGAIAEAPAELIEYLGLRLGMPRKSKKTTAEPTDEADLEILRQAVDAVLGVGWSSPFQSREGERGMDGVTPGHSSRMRFGVQKGRVWGHSFHVSYDTHGTVAMVQAEYDQRPPDPGGPGTPRGPGGPGTGGDGGPDGGKPGLQGDGVEPLDSSDVPPPPTEEDERTAKDCEEAFGQITGIGVVIGTTGTGKSYQAAKRAIDRHDLGERTMLVAQDKEGIETMRRYVLDHWTSAGRDPKELRMQILVSTSANEEAEESSESAGPSSAKSSINVSTLIVITHHHFASRKPLTTKLYSALYWVAEHHAEVILDEADLYIERQNHHLQLDARYTMIGGMERGQWTRGNHCPSAKGSFRCKGCTKRGGGRVVNLQTHNAFRSQLQLMPSQFEKLAPEEFEILPENLPVDQTIDLPSLNLRLSSLSQTQGYLQQRDFTRKPEILHKDEVKPTPKQEMMRYLRDLIECSHMPTQADPRLVDDKNAIVEFDPHEHAITNGPDGKLLLDSDKSATMKFPYFLCQTRYLLLYDRAALFFMMRSASRVIVMSATVSDQNLDFLRNCADGKPVVVVTIPAPHRNPLDQVVIIGHQGRAEWMKPLGERAARAMGCNYTDVGLSNRTTIERLGNALSVAGKRPLVFMPTKGEASLVFRFTKERGWNFYIEGEYHMHSGQAVAETQTTDGSLALLTYSRSSLGTGANLPKYDVVVVDGTVKRPHYVFNPALKTEDAYLVAQESDRVRVMVQNVGRILRGTGVKYVFVVGVSPAQLSKMATEVERLARTKTASWFTADDTVVAMAALVASVKAGHLVIPVVPAEEPKRREQKSRKQRAKEDAAGEGSETTSGDSFAKSVARVEEMAREGKTWRSASRAVNAARLEPDLKAKLKSAYEAAYAPGRAQKTPSA
jgi:hypothetical protein